MSELRVTAMQLRGIVKALAGVDGGSQVLLREPYGSEEAAGVLDVMVEVPRPNSRNDWDVWIAPAGVSAAFPYESRGGDK